MEHWGADTVYFLYVQIYMVMRFVLRSSELTRIVRKENRIELMHAFKVRTVSRLASTENNRKKRPFFSTFTWKTLRVLLKKLYIQDAAWLS